MFSQGFLPRTKALDKSTFLPDATRFVVFNLQGFIVLRQSTSVTKFIQQMWRYFTLKQSFKLTLFAKN